MRTKSFLVALIIAALAMPAFASLGFAQAPQGAPPPATNVRGKVVKLDGQNLTVKTREGQTVAIALAPNTSVRALAKKKLSDIKPGDNVASTSLPGKDGKLHAVEVHFLPPVVPESQSPYDFKPGSVMTNAKVSGVAKAKNGNVLTVSLKGQPTDIIIDKNTVIVGPADASMADVKPGKAIFLRATKAADGSYSANNITIEKNGVKPPM
jgi:hypothetical protein